MLQLPQAAVPVLGLLRIRFEVCLFVRVCNCAYNPTHVAERKDIHCRDISVCLFVRLFVALLRVE